MKVFIDTQIYLKLFEPPGDELGYLKKLEQLIKNKTISVIFPKITRNEVYRNIDNYFKQPRKKIEDLKPNKLEISEKFNKAEEALIEEAYKDFDKAISNAKESYLNRLEEAINKVKNELFEAYQKLTIDFLETDELTKKAYYRKQKGYPPGKQQHLGDELAWEILLNHFSDDDLSIISADSDWCSEDKEKKSIHPVLLEEWKIRTKKKLELFTSLGEFLKGYEVGKDIKQEDINAEKRRIPVVGGNLLNDYMYGSIPSEYISSSPSQSKSFGSINVAPLPSSSGASLSNLLNLTTKQCLFCNFIWLGSKNSEVCPNCGQFS